MSVAKEEFLSSLLDRRASPTKLDRNTTEQQERKRTQAPLGNCG